MTFEEKLAYHWCGGSGSWVITLFSKEGTVVEEIPKVSAFRMHEIELDFELDKQTAKLTLLDVEMKKFREIDLSTEGVCRFEIQSKHGGAGALGVEKPSGYKPYQIDAIQRLGATLRNAQS